MLTIVEELRFRLRLEIEKSSLAAAGQATPLMLWPPIASFLIL